jgi:hypothetical protein
MRESSAHQLIDEFRNCRISIIYTIEVTLFQGKGKRIACTSRSEKIRRYHISEKSIQNAMENAVRRLLELTYDVIGFDFQYYHVHIRPQDERVTMLLLQWYNP